MYAPRVSPPPNQPSSQHDTMITNDIITQKHLEQKQAKKNDSKKALHKQKLFDKLADLYP